MRNNQSLGARLNNQTLDIYKNLYSQPAFVPQFAEGGLIEGPGTGTSDSIEKPIPRNGFIIPAKVVAVLGADFLQKYNEAAAEESEEPGEMIPAKVSDGEFEISPEAVEMFGAEHFEELVELVTGQGTDPQESAEGEVMAAAGYNPEDEATYNSLKERTANAANSAGQQSQALRAANPNISPVMLSTSASSQTASERLNQAASNAAQQSQTLRAANPNIGQASATPEGARFENLKQRLNATGYNDESRYLANQIRGSSGTGINVGPDDAITAAKPKIDPYTGAVAKDSKFLNAAGKVGNAIYDVGKGIALQEGLDTARRTLYNRLPQSGLTNVIGAGVTALTGDREAAKNQLFGQPIDDLSPPVRAVVDATGAGFSPVAQKVASAFGDKQPTGQERQAEIKNAITAPQGPRTPPPYEQQQFGDTVRTQFTQAGYNADPGRDRLPQTGNLPASPEERAQLQREQAFQNFSRYLDKVATVQEEANRRNELRQQDFLQRFGVPIDNETRVDAGSVAQVQGNEARSLDQQGLNETELAKARLVERLGRDTLNQPKFNARVTDNGDVVQYQESGAGAPERADAAARQATQQAEAQQAEVLFNYYKENGEEHPPAEHLKLLKKYFPTSVWAKAKDQ